MIDINELRRLAQAATHPTTKGRWIRLFGERTVYDRLEDGCRGIPVVSTPAHPPHPFEAACLDFIAAANPAAITELLDRLEAAESDAAHQKALADSALRVAEGWEEKCNALRAKIEAMEKQEPVGEIQRANSTGNYICSEVWVPLSVGAKFYALPGAQNVPEKLCYDSRWEISIDYVDGWNAAVDMMRGKSPSWYCPDCCIVFPFGEPKSCPHDDARCNRALKAAPEVGGK